MIYFDVQKPDVQKQKPQLMSSRENDMDKNG